MCHIFICVTCYIWYINLDICGLYLGDLCKVESLYNLIKIYEYSDRNNAFYQF